MSAEGHGNIPRLSQSVEEKSTQDLGDPFRIMQPAARSLHFSFDDCDTYERVQRALTEFPKRDISAVSNTNYPTDKPCG